MSIALPPEVSERALQAFREVVGSEHVLTAPDQMREFRDPFWHLDWDDYEAAAVVQPESVEEIQAIVRLTNEQRVPLWTTSQGRNNGLWRIVAPRARVGGGEPAADEPRAHDRRGAGIRGGRAWGQLV